MWTLRSRQIFKRLPQTARQARQYSSSHFNNTSRSPSTSATIVLTATLTASACYAYSLVTGVNGVNVVYADADASRGRAKDGGDGGYADGSHSTKGVEEEARKSPPKQYCSKSDLPKVIDLLRTALGPSSISTEPSNLIGHAQAGGTHHHPASPDVIAYVQSTEDVVKVMKIADEWRVPVVPYGGGTSLEGHITAPYGGICVDLSGMDKVLELRVEDSDMTLQPGKPWEEINSDLADAGIPLFFPLDPGPGATIGGMIGTGCSGTNACRYGTAKAEWVLNVTAVLADGEVIKTRSRARKSSAGFDLTKLFIGAEGTLGIVTEATIRLAPLLPTTVAVSGFPSVEKAVAAVGEVINQGVPIQCVELCDALTMKALRDHGNLPLELPLADSIFFKFQGNPQAMLEAQELTATIAKKHGGRDMIFAKNKEEAGEIWQARKGVHWSILALVPDGKAYSTDVCVPVSKLPQLCKETAEDLAKHNIVGPMLGHVGDGNFHCGLIFPEGDFDKVDAAAHRMVNRAIALGGTCTGEHGVGVGKKDYLRKELGDGTVEVMKRVKEMMDPKGILNPGKLYPD